MKDYIFNYSQIEKDGYVVQGYTIANQEFIVSCHAEESKFRKFFHLANRCSRLYIFDSLSKKLTGVITLNHSAHVGGISYDSLHDALYVTGGSGKVHTYCYHKLKEKMVKKHNILWADFSKGQDISSCIISNGNLNIRKLDGLNKIVSAATLYCYGSYLYVATCSDVGDVVCYHLEYSLDSSSVVAIKEKEYHNLAPAIQGIAVYEQNNKKYLLFSQSYGRKIFSAIKCYEIISHSLLFIGQEVIPISGMEGIYVDSSGTISAVFEHSSKDSYVTYFKNLTSNIDSLLEEKFVLGGRKNQQRVLENAMKKSKK